MTTLEKMETVRKILTLMKSRVVVDFLMTTAYCVLLHTKKENYGSTGYCMATHGQEIVPELVNTESK